MQEESDMRRAIIALIGATALVLTGLTPGPQRATALGETSVTLTCTDDTSITVLVDADALAGLTAAVQAMIDYPAGLSCTLVQNPLPLTLSLGRNVALAANPNTMVVTGGRWLAPCSQILPPPPGCDEGFDGCCSGVPGDPDCPSETVVPVVVAHVATRPALARVLPAPLSSTSCPIDPVFGCVWVNIGVNLHFRDKTTTLEGTLNETIPENQFCPDPVGGEPVAVGPSHFTSKPTPSQNQALTGCLDVDTKRAFTTTYVTHVFGPAFTTLRETPLEVNSPIHFSFRDNGNPSNAIDKLAGVPAEEESICESGTGKDPPTYELERGNTNVYGQT
jgi:hypothetical protein